MIAVTFCCHMRRDMRIRTRDAAKRIVMAACMLHGACFGEEAGARNLVFFRLKRLQPAMNKVPCVCGGCGCDRFGRNRFSLGVPQRVDANRIVMAAWMCM